MTILYKENDPNDMANYQPISLCNTHNKLVTRLLNHRMMEVAKQSINENKPGFVFRRYIFQNSLRCQMSTEDAERTMNLAKKHNIAHQLQKPLESILTKKKRTIELTSRISNVPSTDIAFPLLLIAALST